MPNNNVPNRLELPKSPVSQQDFDAWRLKATKEFESFTQIPRENLAELIRQHEENTQTANRYSENLAKVENENWGLLGFYKTAEQTQVIEETRLTLYALLEVNHQDKERIDVLKNNLSQLTKNYNLEGKTQQILAENPTLKLRDLDVIAKEEIGRKFYEIYEQQQKERIQQQEIEFEKNPKYYQLKQELNDKKEDLSKLKHTRALAELADQGRTPIGTPVDGWIEISRNEIELEKLGFKPRHFTDFQTSNVQARIFKPDPTVFGENTNEMKAVVVFPPSRLPNMSSFKDFWDSLDGVKDDWLVSNKSQAFGEKTPAYNYAIALGKVIREEGTADKIECTGTSLAGGLCATFSMTSGAKATSFNPPGLHENTINVIDKPIMNNIEVYRINGEVLTNLQNRNNGMNEDLSWWEWKGLAINSIGDVIPEANYGNIHELPEQKGTFSDHGIENVKEALDKQIVEQETEIKSMQRNLDKLRNQLINSTQSISMGIGL